MNTNTSIRPQVFEYRIIRSPLDETNLCKYFEKIKYFGRQIVLKWISPAFFLHSLYILCIPSQNATVAHRDVKMYILAQ